MFSLGNPRICLVLDGSCFSVPKVYARIKNTSWSTENSLIVSFLFIFFPYIYFWYWDHFLFFSFLFVFSWRKLYFFQSLTENFSINDIKCKETFLQTLGYFFSLLTKKYRSVISESHISLGYLLSLVVKAWLSFEKLFIR